jgi:hypothetical protein
MLKKDKTESLPERKAFLLRPDPLKGRKEKVKSFK